MKLKIERETKYKSGEITTYYFVWVDSVIVDGFKSEDEAKKLVDKIKNNIKDNNTKIGSETIFEEEI